MRVAVLCGGNSAEREVSLRSGEAVYRALRERGWEAVKIDVGPDIALRLSEVKPDVVFLALHGKGGEDGSIQGLLEVMGLPYTGPGILASALAMNKIATKRYLLSASLPTPDFIILDKEESPDEWLRRVKEFRSFPVVVKAPTQGSSLGMSIVRREEELLPALMEAFRYDPVILVEEFIEGVEVTAAVLGNRKPVVLPLIEIVADKGVYDYEAKYTPGKSRHIIPPRLPEPWQEKIKELALATYRWLDCRGFSRIDFMVNRTGNPYILEVNTIPGLTEVSLFPDAARAAGMSFGELVEKLIYLALGQEE
ncbi:D-alanine--D-alanine ligase [Ammonifex thiophilus]|uniref:D-alanine--D-alanine ligase n=1 Tax=Ammonifex thiophilus TaxID=444093 RepID=A0A3D8P6D9_9THEO|nr:D-alanine--D-alanine ligase [Ammonifex thiophilus]RDV84086.1 D-alanine--D-alanine ligase [Ammonifex thiophilus]